MKAKKAERADKPRIVMTWRIKENTVDEIRRFAKKYKCSESEVIESAVYAFEGAKK